MAATAIRTENVSHILPQEREPDVSVVVPCLNEEETLGEVIETVLRAFEQNGIDGELIVSDNGSTDRSIAIAQSYSGVRVIHAPKKGYGNALMAGIAQAKSRYVIMGDADCSYDFSEIPNFLAKLRDGFDIVQGCRLPSGGGTVAKGAMPFSHRWIGNPALTFVARTFFRAPIHDVYCGLRGFTKACYESLDQRCGGMEFAVEMVAKSALSRKRFAEVPITLHPDKRVVGRPHLRTIRDGWRTLRFFLLASPTWLFFIPGTMMGICGAMIAALALAGASFGSIQLGSHTLLAGCLLAICGYQTVLFSMFANVFNYNTGTFPVGSGMKTFMRWLSLEKIIGFGLGVGALGIALLGTIAREWIASDFGRLSYADTLPVFIPGFTLVLTGFLTVMSGFMASLLSLFSDPPQEKQQSDR